jgi:DNA-binding response OmpR family regulator
MNAAKIFIIDDERTIRLTFRLALETDGYLVQEAATADEAMMGFLAEEYALAILDLRIGEDSGLDVLGEMRRRGLQTPTLMITAYGSIRQAVRAMQLGAIDFLEKPIEPVALRRIVAEILDRHQPRSVPPNEPTAIGNLVREAKRLINLQDFASAAACVAAALKIDDAAPEVYNLQGVLAEIHGDYDAARRAYGRAIQLHSHYEPAQQNVRRLFELFNFGSSQETLHPGQNPEPHLDLRSRAAGL